MRRPRSRGFTLIELLLAVSLLALLVGATAPTFVRSLGNARISSAARAVVTMARFARFHAIMHARPVFLVVDIPAGRIWLQDRPEEGMELALSEEFLDAFAAREAAEAETWDAASAAAGIAGAGDAGPDTAFADGLAEIRPYEVPAGVRLDTLVFAESERLDAARAGVAFLPNGTCQEFSLVMEDRRGHRLEIWFDPLTGSPEVYRVREEG